MTDRAESRPLGEPAAGAAQAVDGRQAAMPVAKISRPPPPWVQSFDNLDRLLHAFQARLTAGVSLAAVAAARMDWLAHLANAPGRQLSLAQKAAFDGGQLAAFAARALAGPTAEPPFAAKDDDRRFAISLTAEERQDLINFLAAL